MSIEVSGWTIEPVVGIGDFAAAGALIASVVTFVVSHLLAKKYEERRIEQEEQLREAQRRSEERRIEREEKLREAQDRSQQSKIAHQLVDSFRKNVLKQRPYLLKFEKSTPEDKEESILKSIQYYQNALQILSIILI